MRVAFVLAWLFSLNSHAFCFEEAGARFDINPKLLEAIAYTESRLNHSAINSSNTNGSTDYGLMQINSFWFEKLANLGVSEVRVINDPCTNVHVGAWILANNFAQSGEGWLAVGAYNAGYRADRQKARDKYISIVQKNLMELQP